MLPFRCNFSVKNGLPRQKNEKLPLTTQHSTHRGSGLCLSPSFCQASLGVKCGLSSISSSWLQTNKNAPSELKYNYYFLIKKQQDIVREWVNVLLNLFLKITNIMSLPIPKIYPPLVCSSPNDVRATKCFSWTLQCCHSLLCKRSPSLETVTAIFFFFFLMLR